MIKYNNDYDDIENIFKNWNKIDHENYYKYKLKKIKKFQNLKNFKNIKTSGSSSCCPKKYKWGPDYHKHFHFYNNIFYDNQEFKNFYMLPHIDNSYKINKESISLGFFNGVAKNLDRVLKNIHITCNPEVLFIHIKKYGDFLDNFFDKKSCIFCFTGSALQNEHKKLFADIGLTYKDFMRCWDGGATYFTCKYLNKHWANFSSIIKIENQKLISTDLWNLAEPFVDYWNKDVLTSENTKWCECGLMSCNIKWEPNPKYFVIKKKQFSYESLCSSLKKFLEFDFLSIEYCDDLLVVNISSSNLFDKNYLEKKIKEVVNTKVIVNKTLLPYYKRKYTRVKKINHLNKI